MKSHLPSPSSQMGVALRLKTDSCKCDNYDQFNQEDTTNLRWHEAVADAKRVSRRCPLKRMQRSGLVEGQHEVLARFEQQVHVARSIVALSRRINFRTGRRKDRIAFAVP